MKSIYIIKAIDKIKENFFLVYLNKDLDPVDMKRAKDNVVCFNGRRFNFLFQYIDNAIAVQTETLGDELIGSELVFE